jgi:hypothetical protein
LFVGVLELVALGDNYDGTDPDPEDPACSFPTLRDRDWYLKILVLAEIRDVFVCRLWVAGASTFSGLAAVEIRKYRYLPAGASGAVCGRCSILVRFVHAEARVFPRHPADSPGRELGR